MRGPWIVARPPFIKNVTPMASAASLPTPAGYAEVGQRHSADSTDADGPAYGRCPMCTGVLPTGSRYETDRQPRSRAMHTFINSRAMAQMVAFDLIQDDISRAEVRRERRARRQVGRPRGRPPRRRRGSAHPPAVTRGAGPAPRCTDRRTTVSRGRRPRSVPR